MFRIFLLFIISIIAFSCTYKHERLDFNTVEKQDKLNFSEVFSSSELIFLEEMEDNQVFQIDKLITTENRFFIGDIEMSEGLFAFDKTGKFLWNMYSSIGAPSEFTELSDFDVNEEEEKIYVLSTGQGRVFVYDFGGQFVEDFKIPDQLIVYNIASLGDNKFIFYRDLIKETKVDYPYQIISYDMTTNEYIDQDLPIPARQLLHSNDFNISRNADQLFISQVYSSTLFSCSSSGQFSEYLKLGGFNTIDELDGIADSGEFSQTLANMDLHLFLGMFLGGPDFTSFMYREGKYTRMFFENRRTNFSRAFKGFNFDLEDYPVSHFMNAYQNDIYAQIDEEIFTYFATSKPESSLAKAIVSNNQSMSPILVKLTLK